MIDFTLTEEHKMVKKASSDFAKRLAPQRDKILLSKDHRQATDFLKEAWKGMGELGLLGCIIPEKYGGNNTGLMTMVMMTEEMSAQGVGTPIIVTTMMDVACLLRCASEGLKQKYLPPVAAGDMRLAFALTEPDAGSNAVKIKTEAKKDGNIYRITGQKIFITGADVADAMLLVTRTTSYEDTAKQGKPRFYGLTLFMVDMKSKGITMSKIPIHGFEGAQQYVIYLDNVEVPASQLVGQENMGGIALFNSLNPERIIAAADAVGISEYALHRAVDYAKQRKVFKDTPIGAYQAIQHPLAESRIELEAARLLTYKAAWAWDQGLPPPEVGKWANMAKITASDMALKCVDRAIETLGGYAFSEEYGIIHLWDMARILKTIPVSRENVLNFVGEHVLGLPKSY
ncbi:MAG: acyl-CoA dehydrogenase family protein [Euryarchaeota archaeon]|nr:acyl-CoA dehydrogenase family protein [Euryarchaeota archaeon]